MEYLFINENGKNLYKGTPKEIAELVERLANIDIEDIEDEE